MLDAVSPRPYPTFSKTESLPPILLNEDAVTSEPDVEFFAIVLISAGYYLNKFSGEYKYRIYSNIPYFIKNFSNRHEIYPEINFSNLILMVRCLLRRKSGTTILIKACFSYRNLVDFLALIIPEYYNCIFIWILNSLNKIPKTKIPNLLKH